MRMISISFLLFLLLFISCVLAIAATEKEIGNDAADADSIIKHHLSLDLAVEFVKLSEAVYDMSSCQRPGHNFPSIGTDIKCHLYHRDAFGTQVAVVSSLSKQYVAVVYAGSDNMRDWVHDFDIAVEAFGPENSPIRTDVGVHKGFNREVFHDDLYDRLLAKVKEVLDDYDDSASKEEYRIITSGHSLGAAAAVLSGAALALDLPERTVVSYNFGCPRTGNRAWKRFMNSDENIPNLTVWRFVYKDDIVPRVPPTVRFEHVGHTLQLYRKHAYAYYLHHGDEVLGLAGVPGMWEASSFIDSIGSGNHHHVANYVRYLTQKSLRNPTQYFPEHFKRTNETNALINKVDFDFALNNDKNATTTTM